MKHLMINFYWAWQVLTAKAYIIATDKRAVCNLPFEDPDSFTNILMLSSQQAALTQFRDTLTELIDEHGQAIELRARQEALEREKTKN